jgi:histidinol dehydrogenase
VRSKLLPRREPGEIPRLARDAVDPAALEIAQEICEDVRLRGLVALLEHGRRFGDLGDAGPWRYDRRSLEAARRRVGGVIEGLLERTAARIERFARMQMEGLGERTLEVPGGVAGQTFVAVERAACYAPGGRYALPSSVLMTAVTARVAGVSQVVVASPRPSDVTLAAAAVAGADCLVGVGGAQVIGAFAYGLEGLEPCDLIVGPGNRFVTAAKQLVSGRVSIDMLAGPSELVVVADACADAGIIAADLIAQAEHDVAALPVLIALDESLIVAVRDQLEAQLTSLPTEGTARPALRDGFAVLAVDRAQAVELCDRLAPEHLQVMLADCAPFAAQLKHAGAIFLGAGSAEVLGDYGAGPNHVLPTGGTARRQGGLSVHSFLRPRTWLRIDDTSAASQLIDDAAALARLEGLEGHARAAEARRS